MGSPLRLLLDTHVIDELAADPSLRLQLRRAVEAGTVVLLVTHLQIDEVLAMPLQKMEHQQELLQQLGSLVATRVPTAGAVWRRSRWDESTWMSDDDAELLGRPTR